MIQLKNINRVKALNNFCLVKISNLGFDGKLKLPGTEIEVDTTFSPEKHVELIGQVVRIPDRLTYQYRSRPGFPVNSMPWRTRIEIEKGDMVYIDYLEVLSALGSFFSPMVNNNETSRFIITPAHDLYVFAHYSRIYAKLGEKGLKPINGNVILDATRSGIHRIKTSRGWDQFSKVLYTGNPVIKYIHNKNAKDAIVEPGDWVMVRKYHQILLEHDLYKKQDTRMSVVQGRDIIAKRNDI